MIVVIILALLVAALILAMLGTDITRPSYQSPRQLKAWAERVTKHGEPKAWHSILAFAVTLGGAVGVIALCVWAFG